MKGLLYKDMLILGKTNKLILFMMICFFIGFAVSVNETGMLFQVGMILAVSMMFGIFGYDERVSWQRYCHTTPILRPKYVLSKYILTLIMIIGVAGIFYLTQFSLYFMYQAVDLGGLFFYFSYIFSELALVFALLLPIIFGIGVEKARILYFVCIIAYGFVYGVWMELIARGILDRMLSSVLVLGFSSLIFCASYPVAVVIYNRRKVI